MTIGEKIKQARIAKGMTQEDLGEKLGYKSRSSINKIETGERDIPRSQLKKIAHILGVSPISLLGLDDEDTVNIAQEDEKTSSVPEGTKDEFINAVMEMSEDEVRELRTFVHFLKYKRDHRDFPEE